MSKTNETRFKLFPTQDDFVRCKDPFSGFFAGVGSGKTRGGAVKGCVYASEYEGSLGLIGAPTFPMLRDSTLRTVFEVFPPNLIAKYDKSDMVLKLTNGSEVLLRSLDDPEKARGPNLAWFWLDEGALCKPDAWKILVGRLRQPNFPHQGWVTTTPKGYNWCFQEFVVQERPDYKFFHCSTRENKYLPEDYLKRLEESYKDNPEFALQELEGQFLPVGGRMLFPIDILKVMLGDCREPIEEYDACVEVWKPPVVAGKYVGGCDFCWGETNSYAVAQILDFQTGEQVAKIRGRIQPDEMADKFVKLCDRYNRAYAVAEANSEGKHGVNKMIELGYGDRMYHRDPDWYIRDDKRGWWTDAKTRPLMLSELEEAVRQRLLIVNSKNTVEEMMAFIRNENGKLGPTEGAYSDEVMSMAMAWHGRQFATFGEAAKFKVTSY